jgi:hypothetical protein
MREAWEMQTLEQQGQQLLHVASGRPDQIGLEHMSNKCHCSTVAYSYSSQRVQYRYSTSYSIATSFEQRQDCVIVLVPAWHVIRHPVIRWFPRLLHRLDERPAEMPFYQLSYVVCAESVVLANGRFSYENHDKERVSHPTTAQYE